MDLQYLLLLQELRMSAGGYLTPILMFISHFVIAGSAAICIIVYWAYDRRLGYWLVTNTVCGFLLNNVIKLTACVYRPWIRNPAIQPPAEALESATGYSFPSGHTQIATSLYGSIAAKTGKRYPVITVLCVLSVFLAGFSRNYLGVHTPQDVLVSILLGIVLILANTALFKKFDRDPSMISCAIAAGLVFCGLCVLYFHFKTYPMDYIDGALVVDPAKMRTDGYKAVGAAAGYLAGAFCEIRFIRFQTDGSVGRRVLRVLGGLPGAALIMFALKEPVYSLLGSGAGHFVLYMILFFYIAAAYPALFTYVRSRLDQR